MNARIFPEIEAIYTHWVIWFTLASQDIKLRYKRSMLGPLWITLSMGITIYTMGFLYGNLFNVDLAKYFPYLASGLICWTFISVLIIESGEIFIHSEAYIRNQEIFVSLFIMRMIFRNLLVFAHNLLTFIPMILIFKPTIGLKTLLIFPGLFIISLNVFFLGTVLAIISTRYRDFSQIVKSLVQVVFFLTPVMWMPSALSAKNQWIVQYNPFNQFLNLIRAPLLNESMSAIGLMMVSVSTVIGFALYCLLLKKYKHRIVFWL